MVNYLTSRYQAPRAPDKDDDTTTTTMDDIEQRLPPGFWSHPTDEQVLIEFLSNKAAPASLLAVDVDLNHVEPWDLPFDKKLWPQSSYLFSFQSRRYGQNPTRSTAGSNAAANEVSGGKNIFTSARATWHVASAAFHHMTGNKNLLTDMVPISDHHHIDVVDGSRIEVHGRGSVKTENIVLHDVWYVPGLTSNLVSASQLAQLDLTVGFSRSACQIKSGSDGSVVGRGQSAADGMFKLEFLKVPTTPS